MDKLNELVRPNILTAPRPDAYRRHHGKDITVTLDANESPYNTPYNRLPDPRHTLLREELSKVKAVPPECIFTGNGTDEIVDLILRIFCTPGQDDVITITPTCGPYARLAAIHGVECHKVELNRYFDLPEDEIVACCGINTKVVFLCSPNNPTGNLLDPCGIFAPLGSNNRIVVVDESYGDFSQEKSLRHQLEENPCLIVLDSLSTAWASAGIQLGMAFASPEIIALLDKVRNPYNLNTPVQEQALGILKRRYDVDTWVKRLREERDRVMLALDQLPFCQKVYPTDTNFILVKMDNASRVHKYLAEKGIAVANCSHLPLCAECLRITIGTPQENSRLLGALRQFD